MRRPRLLFGAVLVAGFCLWFFWPEAAPVLPSNVESNPPTPGPPARNAAAPIALVEAFVAPEPPAAFGAFEGKVVSRADGQGIPGAELTFDCNGIAFTARTNDEGAFRFVPEREGLHRVAVILADGFLAFAPGWGQSPVTLMDVKGQKLRGLTFTLGPKISYEGEVVDPQGRRVSSAEVVILDSGEDTQDMVPLQDRFLTDSEGRFSFHAPVDSLLEARHPSFSPGRARVDIQVRAGHPLKLRLSPLSQKPPQDTMRGRVVIEGGQGVEGARVQAFARADLGSSPRAVSQPDGVFELTGLDPGTYDVVARLDGYVPARARGIQASSSDVILLLRKGGRIRGVVRDMKGQPVPSFSLELTATRGRHRRWPYLRTSVVDPSGTFEVSGVAPGAYQLRALAFGYAPSAPVSVEMTSGLEARADLKLSQGGRLHGRVLDEKTRAPIRGAQVTMEGSFDGEESLLSVQSSTSTRTDGRFELGGFPPGRQSITVMAAGHHGRVLSGLEMQDNGDVGPLEVELTPVAPGEDPRLELVGIGAALTVADDVLMVRQVLPGGGAAEVGLKSGDRILGIDGRSVGELGFEESVQMIRGVEGTFVTLKVHKAEQNQAVDLMVRRRRIRG